MNTRKGTNSLSYKSDSQRYDIHKLANETLEREGIEAAVICPEDVDPNEWIAVHIIDFYNDVNLIFSMVQDECTTYSCPIMSAGENYEFLWTDKYKYRKPTRLPAKMYIDYLMNWIVYLIEDVTLFPVEPNIPFPNDYRDRVRNIFRRMFRVYAHIYYSHYALIHELQLTDQFKFSLSHFLYFVNQFHLVDHSDIRPLREFITQLVPDLPLTKKMNEAYERRERAIQLTNSVSHNVELRDETPKVSYLKIESGIPQGSVLDVHQQSGSIETQPPSKPLDHLEPVINEEHLLEEDRKELSNEEQAETVLCDLETAAETTETEEKDDNKCACVVT